MEWMYVAAAPASHIQRNPQLYYPLTCKILIVTLDHMFLTTNMAW